MIVVEKIMMQRRDPNGLQKEYHKNTTNLTELLLQCVTQPDSMLSMLEWLCTELMRGSKLKMLVPLALISTALIPRGISVSYTRIALP